MEGAEVAVGVPDRRDGGAVTLRLTGEPGLAGFGRCDSVLKSDTVSIVILRFYEEVPCSLCGRRR